jgi:hypothetical protein
MEKDFDNWNTKKKTINKETQTTNLQLKLVCPRLRGGEAEAIYANQYMPTRVKVK